MHFYKLLQKSSKSLGGIAECLNKLSICCMTHAACADVVPPEKEKYGVQNTMGYKWEIVNVTTDILSVSSVVREIR